MSCLQPSSDLFLQFSSHLIFLLCLVLFLLSQVGESQNVDLVFPLFNDTNFQCTGIPSNVQKDYCRFNATQFVDLLPSAYNEAYPDQAGRMMYKTPIIFWTSDNKDLADFSTFIIFSISHVTDHAQLGAGIAFLIAPDLDTPDNSGDGSFGLFTYDYKTKQPVSGSIPMVVAIEFDTAVTPGVDTAAVPHIGLDVNNIVSKNTAVLDSTYVDAPVAMWIDYNSTLMSISVYVLLIGDKDSNSAFSYKPTTPILTGANISLKETIKRQSYIGISAGIASGEWESNKIFFWSFQTFGLPPLSLIAAWYQWFSNLSTTKKVGVIIGGVIGTVGGAYACSECVFFAFFKRIKKPATPAEKRWPVRRRKTLIGIKEKPPRKKARDSLSVANPLNLWGTPLEPEEGPHVHLESPKDPEGKDVLTDSSDDEEKEKAKQPNNVTSALVASTDVEGPEITEEVSARRPSQSDRKVAFARAKKHPSSPAKPTPSQPEKKVPLQAGPQKEVPQKSPLSKPLPPARKGVGPSPLKKLPPKPPKPSPQSSPKTASPRAPPDKSPKKSP